MDPFEQSYALKAQMSDSVNTLETDDVTNQSSTSSGLGASLDMDVHGGTSRTQHQRSSQRGHHLRFNDSLDGFGESFMLEESFAMGESFSCYDENGGTLESQRGRFVRERPDITTVLAIEEDEEGESTDFLEDRDSIHELERETRKLALQSQTSNISVEG